MDFEAFCGEIQKRKLKVYGIELLENGVVTNRFGDVKKTRYPVYSVTKAILSLGVGIAWDRGLFDLNRGILSYLPQEYVDAMEDKQKAAFSEITVARLMCMSVPGFPFRAEGDDYLSFALSCPVGTERTYNYSNISAYLVGVALAQALGGDVWEFLTDNLLHPLHIYGATCERCPKGWFYGASGMKLTVHELGRIGLLVCSGGVLEGKRIVSAEYLAMASSAQQPCREGGYGYCMWPYYGGVRISGKWGQRSYIFPKTGIVLSLLSDNPDHSDEVDRLVAEYLFPEETGKRSAADTGKQTGQEPSVICPYAKKCGGCDYQGVPYEEQLAKKQKTVRILLDRFARPEPIVPAEHPTHYRNKVHGVFGRDKKGNIFTGIYEEKSHRIVPVRDCGIENRSATAILHTLCELAKSFKIRIYDEDKGTGMLRHALIRVAQGGSEIMVVLVVTDPVFPSKNNFTRELVRRHPEISTVVLNINDRDTSMVLGERNIVLYGRGYIEDVLCGLRFRISPSAFFQVNSEQTQMLYDTALSFAGLTGTERVIDAYCGTGTIGMCAAGKAKEVIGVELNRDAVRDAQSNAKRNGVANISFVNDDAGRYMLSLAAAKEPVDVVIMDPPRSGSTPEFITAVDTLHPSKVIYVSCDPETLQRDLALFVKKGWSVTRIRPVDMFPYTRHIETVVLLSRA